MNDIEIFFYSVLGAIGVEVLPVIQSYSLRVPEIREKYKYWGYWITFSIYLLVSGFLAIALNANTKYLAMQIGASTPIVLQYFRDQASKTYSINQS